MKTAKSTRLLSVIAGWLALAPVDGEAQSPDASKVPSRDEIVALSPFEVVSDKDVGYQGGNSTSGSRLNTSLKDTAAAVMVFTPEFLSDFGVTEVSQLLGYGPNMQIEMGDNESAADTTFFGGAQLSETNFRVRGLQASTSLNFFATNVRIDLYNTERVELSSGANSILFGFGSPGGLINFNSKQAKLDRNRTSFRLQLGEFGLRRFELDHNQVLIPKKLALRLNGLTTRSDSWRRYNYSNGDRYAAAVKFTPLQNTTVTGSYEHGLMHDSVDRLDNAYDSLSLYVASGAPLRSDATYNATADRAVGINRNTSVRTTYITNANGAAPFILRSSNATGRRFLESTYENLNIPAVQRAGSTQVPASVLPYNINTTGPSGGKDTTFDRRTFALEQRLARNLIFDFAYNRETSRQYIQANVNATNKLYRDPNLVIPSPDGSASPIVNPNAGALYFESQWGADKGAFNNRALRGSLLWDLNAGRLGRHKLVGMVQREMSRQHRYGGYEVLVDANNVAISNVALPGNINNQVFRRVYVTPGAFNTYAASDVNKPIAFTENGRTFHNTTVFTNTNGGDTGREVKTTMFATQSSFFAERLIFTGGVRKDRVQFQSHDVRIRDANDPEVLAGKAILNTPIFTEALSRAYNYGPLTTTLGGVIRLNNVVSVFYNHSSNNGQPGMNGRILPDRAFPPPKGGRTDDAGFMLSLLDGKIFLRATAFKVVEEKSAVSLAGGTGIVNPNTDILDTLLANGRISAAEYAKLDLANSAVDPGGLVGLSNRSNKGFEVSTSVNITKNLTALVNASYSNTKIDEAEVAPEFEPWFAASSAIWNRTPGAGALVSPTTGVSVRDNSQLILNRMAGIRDSTYGGFGNRPYKVNASARYSFSQERLKGLFVGGGVRWQSRAVIGRDEFGIDPVTSNTIYGAAFKGPEDFAADAFVGYKWKATLAGFRSDLSLQLNVTNVTDEPTVHVLRYNGNRSGYAHVKLDPPRTFRMTAAMSF